MTAAPANPVCATPFTATPPRPPPAAPQRPMAARVIDASVIPLGAAALAWLVVRADTVLGYRWNWSIIPTYLLRTDPATGAWAPNLLLTGLLTTIRLAVWSLAIGAVIGTALAAMRVWGRPAWRWLARLLIEIVRSVPPIVLIFVVYFFVSTQIMPALGLDRLLRNAPGGLQQAVSALLATPERLNDLLSGLLCLGLLSGVYVAEILRAGLEAVPREQHEAAQALGLRAPAAFRTVILPQALRTVLPALAGQFIVGIKDSSLVALISIQELTFMTSEVSSTTRRFFEAWLFAALLYFVLCFGCSLAFRRLERRLRAA